MHTPTPWEVRNEAQEVYIGIKNQNIAMICHSGHGLTENNYANAAHIIKCVNSHDALVEALKEMTVRYEFLDKRLVNGQHNEINGTIERAKQALKQAEAA